jgi:hypothetical protein
MPKSLAAAFSRLTPDPWRARVGFSAEVETASRRLFAAQASEVDREAALSEWLQKYQPCLFGRIAAKGGFLSYCILTEEDLASSDESICDKIQEARLKWTRAGFEGRKSGFVILAVSERIATALPDEATKELALGLCSLYLLEDVTPDRIFLDEIWLEKPGRDATTWRWNAGVNYFCTQGDGRWWQDHRIPGGMAFSVNSVGHMVKSDILARGMIELERATGAPPEAYVPSKVDSLGKALDLAMRTINNASDAVSGKATRLLPIPTDDAGRPVATCPVPLQPMLTDKNFCEYWGGYHTDYTVPSEYFRPDVERSAGLPEHLLDFTYIFHKSIDNPDHTTTGEGRRIRIDDDGRPADAAPVSKERRMAPDTVPISACVRLKQALRDV